MSNIFKKAGKAIKKGWDKTSGLGLDITGLGGIIGGPLGANIFDPLDITGSTARSYQDYSAGKEMSFNAQEAEKQRAFQMLMSNTAHQREMADLKAAGINPVLTASGGVGASTPSGAAATGAMAGSAEGNAAALGTILNAFSAIKNASSTARATKSQAELNSMQEKNIANEIQNRDLNTAQNIAESQTRIAKLNEETKNQWQENLINEMLGISSKDQGKPRDIAWYNYNVQRTKNTKQQERNAVNKEMLNQVKAQSKAAQAEFDKKVLSKLSKTETMKFVHGDQKTKWRLARIAKQRGAFD